MMYVGSDIKSSPRLKTARVMISLFSLILRGQTSDKYDVRYVR